MSTPPRIHIVGRKNAGKTTLVCTLIQELTRCGLKVASVKHTHHQHELDTPGKDSHRHRISGAVATGILSPHMTALFIPDDREQRADDRYAAFEQAFASSDVILVEGDLHTSGTRIEVWRPEVNELPYAVADPGIHAVISEASLTNLTCPCWPATPVSRLVSLFLELLPQNPAKGTVG